MRLSNITGSKSLVRDLESGAILNTQTSGAETLRLLKEKKQKEKMQLQQNTDDINSMKEEVSEIKDMVKQILGNLSDGR